MVRRFILVLLTFLLVSSCVKKEELIRVRLLDSKYYAKGFYVSEKYIWGYDENVLVKGDIEKIKLDSIILDYSKLGFIF